LTAAAEDGITARLVDHALGLEWADLDDGAQRSAKTFLHDTLCVGAAGARAPNADAVLEIARRWGAGESCRVLGRPGLRLPAASAAFVNGFQIHCQEYDCVHEPAVLHPLATTVAALKAQAELGPCSGANFLAALAAGVDVSVALGLAAVSPIRFFRPSTAGVFGAVAALARLRRLSRSTTLDAFGYALAFASGTMQAHVEGKPALPIQVAAAARSAVVAVDLAVEGLAGAQDAIGGPFGYLALFEAQTDVALVLAQLQGVRRIAQVSWKPFPTGRAAQGGLVAVKQLVEEHGVSGQGLSRLIFTAPPLIRRLVGRPAKPDMDVAYARLCLPWLSAVWLMRGDVGLGDFTRERLDDPALLELAGRITVVEDGSTDPAAFTPLVAVAQSRDGRRAQVCIDAMLGSPAHPLTDEQHLEKASGCLRFAGYEADMHDALAGAIAALDRAPDVAAALPI
jgi:2-methylcitrate dehydratase PrpD